MGIDVELDRGVHGDTPESTDRLRGVGDGERTQSDLAEIFFPVVEEAGETWGLGEGQRAGGGAEQVAAVEEVEHGVLENLGVDRQVAERTLGQAADNGVGDGADARLQRQQVFRETPHFDFVLEELHNVAGNGVGGVVHLGEGTPFVAEF